MIKALIVLIVLFLVATFPATWLLMLFFGNIGIHISYLATLPLGVVASLLISGATTHLPTYP